MNSLNPKRVKILSDLPPGDGPVVYWMSRDQRVRDNWALLYAQRMAIDMKRPLAVLFNLVPSFLGATRRQYSFMLDGLALVEAKLRDYNLPFFLTMGQPPQSLAKFVGKHDVALLVTDFSPLKVNRSWKESVVDETSASVHEVDAHNIVPCWVASDKREYAAYTFRPKINRLLSEYLLNIPKLKRHPFPWKASVGNIDWEKARKSLRVDESVGEVPYFEPGEDAARSMLKKFITKRLAIYADNRNDPTKDAQSQLSPYLHFGHISAQRIALEVGRHDQAVKSQESFLEELIVRRELSDNFCYYAPAYDTIDSFPDWARQTLADHQSDPRPYVYDTATFENAETHDPLWNAAQVEMVKTGKMHGYMRMYWAKKILHWSLSPQHALEAAVYLNDRYSLDGRDPNGYAGIAWSIGGVHDRPWFERDIFGKVRYMSNSGCKRKFDTAGYIQRVDNLR